MIDPTQQQAAPSGAYPSTPSKGIVCIAAQEDGTFKVYMEGAAPSDDSVPDVDAALEKARELLGSGSGHEQSEVNALIDGFKGARGQVGG